MIRNIGLFFVFIVASTAQIDLSGGDPLCQDNDGLCELNSIIEWFRNRYPEKNIWLYTGYTKEEIDNSDNYMMKTIVNNVDVLVDGPYIEEKREQQISPANLGS